MKKLLLEELEKELLKLKTLWTVKEGEIEYFEGALNDLKRIIYLEYLQGRIKELEQVIDYIKQLIQEERNNKQVETLD